MFRSKSTGPNGSGSSVEFEWVKFGGSTITKNDFWKIYNEVSYINLTKKVNFIFLLALFLYSSYCVTQLGMTWDVGFHHELGKARLDYLFSLGSDKASEKILASSESIWSHKFYPGVYATISTFFTFFLSKKYVIESIYLVNLIFSFLAVFGIQKLSSEFLINKLEN